MSGAELTHGYMVNFVKSFLRLSKANYTALNDWIWAEEASTRNPFPLHCSVFLGMRK